MWIFDKVKVKIFINIVNNISSKEIVDVLEEYGKKEFNTEKDDYLDTLRRKFAEVVFEIGQRIGPKGKRL